MILESEELQKVTAHPAHVKDKFGNFLPTALIPFCDFGGNMSVMGLKIDHFEIPFCNSFRPKIVKDQLCYTVDPNDYKHDIDLEGHLSFSLLIDYNEDRQMASEEVEDDNFIIVETIGNLDLKQENKFDTFCNSNHLCDY